MCSTFPKKLISFSWSSRSSHADDTVAGCQSMSIGTAATHTTITVIVRLWDATAVGTRPSENTTQQTSACPMAVPQHVS